MIAYIDMYKDRFGVEPICRTLGATEGGFITSRGYRAAKTRPISDREVRDRQLIPVLCEVHARNYGVYGKRKMWKAMVRDGWEIGREQTARLTCVSVNVRFFGLFHTTSGVCCFC